MPTKVRRIFRSVARFFQKINLLLPLFIHIFVSDILKAHRLFFYNQNLDNFDIKEEFELMLVSFLGTGNLQSSLWAVQGLDYGLNDLPAFLRPYNRKLHDDYLSKTAFVDGVFVNKKIGAYIRLSQSKVVATLQKQTKHFPTLEQHPVENAAFISPMDERPIQNSEFTIHNSKLSAAF